MTATIRSGATPHSETTDHLAADIDRHHRMVTRMSVSRASRLSALLGPTEHLDPGTECDLLNAVQNAALAFDYIAHGVEQQHNRQRYLRSRRDLAPLLTATGIDAEARWALWTLLDDYAREAARLGEIAPTRAVRAHPMSRS